MLQIHKASAGSGKTFALTREYLKLLLGCKGDDGRYRLRPLSAYGHMSPKAHGEILAVTFTNKATEEMTARIIKELALLADESGDGSPYRNDFIKEFGCTQAELAAHAGIALTDLLCNFSWFNVSTIDSFFQGVLNTFSRELDLSPTRNVEIDDHYPLAVAVGNMLMSVNSNRSDGKRNELRRYLEGWLLLYMRSVAADGGGFNLFSRSSGLNADLISDIGKFFNEKYKMNREVIDAYLSDPERIVRFTRAIAPARSLAPLQKLAVESCRRTFQMGSELINHHVANSMGVIAREGLSKPPSGSWQTALENPAKRFRAKVQPSAELEEALDETLRLVNEYFEKKKFYGFLYKWAFNMGLFGQVQMFLEEYRHDNDLLLLSDTSDLLRRIISEDEMPFIYERMGTTIKHYLIDEFQDTSQMQWENLKPLVLESLSRGHDNLIIGDEKQCIYRFRNSDPHLLGNRVEQIVESRFPGALKLRGVDISENCNWRSSADVVRFNNTLFYAMARRMEQGLPGNPVSSTYAGLVQQVAPKNADFRGYIKVEFLPTSSDEQLSREEVEQLQFDRMVKEIDRQLSAGYRPGDIAVLVRKKREGKAVIEKLMDVMENDAGWCHGVIPIVSADSMEINLSPAVRMIVNVLRLTTQPMSVTMPGGEVDADGEPLTEINPAYRRWRMAHRFELCRFDQVQETDSDGNGVFDSEGNPVMRRLTDNEALLKAIAATSTVPGESSDEVQQAIDDEIRSLASMDSPTLMAMTERIIDRFLTPDGRRRENAFITAFQDLVLDFSENGDNNLHSFLEWWDRTGRFSNVAAPEGIDAINVMTIHKAKGLEFECVHLPYCSDKPVKYNDKNVRSVSWYTLDAGFIPEVDAADVPPLLPLPNESGNKEIAALKAEAVEWETEQKTDALNVAYVAFTRAVSEMTVYVDRSEILAAEIGSRKKKTEKSVSPDDMLMSDYLLSALREMTPQHMEMCGITDEVRKRLTP
ncbi:MAG: UvrD-helicase domain-containing protein, partial [Muribaculaceae bacterium]|nr:UvrD-helicase domain-containing protein [Muribaculaceae bacterium]